MKTNEQILAEKVTAYNQIEGPRVGDFLKLPYGIYTRFTYDWGESLQTGGGSNSFYFGNGYMSYSGGLDKGVKRDDIRQTEETREGFIWFFDRGISGAGRGVDFKIAFRVFEPIEGADLSGCPQIERYEREQFLKTVDTVTRINGNGQPYTLPLPEVVIQDQINDAGIGLIESNTGLKFSKCGLGYKAQPVKHEQLNALMLTYNFSCKYYNNGTFQNQLMLRFNRD